MISNARPALAALLFAFAACERVPPPAPAAPPVEPAPPPTAPAEATATAAPPVEAAPAPAAPPGPPPYPEAWIREAEIANADLSCHELVYRNGCYSRRRGTMTAELTLAPDGKVIHAQQVATTIVNQPEVVWRCLAKNLPKWKLHAPDGVTPTLRVTVLLADRC